ncbi:hypothetical protein AVMA1855_12870 [Acidovorax sp. SUPP1855]|uniref:hypothetical protein n=1 Tax=unclassified Acidovorax TaxID=2684926 RepID=UPI0023DE577A|nr:MULTISPECIES: hypothetical protein [unclassified Acidovorax]GKS85048.1 hypothetical protein AVMA1855_12870 [Acidovorax sp. SUPP1855]GKS90135.1 hypothetical protein AVTE2539_12240 [Acidovorax sp. SUPP2539]
MVPEKLGIVLLCCALMACSNNQEPKMNSAASALTKLTANVEAEILYGTGAKDVSDRAVIDKAFEENPMLKPELGANDILLRRGDKGVVVLMCTHDRGTSLLEDLSCTPQMDQHHWRDAPGRACMFSMSPDACP